MLRIETYDGGILQSVEEIPTVPQPLEPAGRIATLLAVLELVPLSDAAAVAGLPEQALVDEALAWGL
jgi:hypothetical protein